MKSLFPENTSATLPTDTKDMPPRINPDRRYRIHELEAWGYLKGSIYKRHKHLIQKDGGLSYMLGSNVLALGKNAPTLASSPPQPSARRPRGRPRKVLAVPAPGGQDKQ